MTLSLHSAWLRASASIPVLGLALAAAPGPAAADETCQSPYMAKITGHEEFVYIWTLGVDGLGDGSDKVVTVDVRPDSPTFGEVVDVDSVGGRHEAHHGDFTDDRRFFWVSGLDTSKIFVFDVHSNPADPKLVKTIDDFVEKTGVVGPHGAYALPGRMMISGLSNSADHGGQLLLIFDLFADRIIGVDRRIAEQWGRLNARQSRPAIDGLLAATALVHSLTMVTRNARDFANTGVEVLNPFQATP